MRLSNYPTLFWFLQAKERGRPGFFGFARKKSKTFFQITKDKKYHTQKAN